MKFREYTLFAYTAIAQRLGRFGPLYFESRVFRLHDEWHGDTRLICGFGEPWVLSGARVFNIQSIACEIVSVPSHTEGSREVGIQAESCCRGLLGVPSVDILD